MNNVTQIVQRYRQAPWRIQRQWIGLFLLALVLVALVAGIYLYVTAQAALAGREIQLLEAEIIKNQRANADLETQLATLTSAESMEERADDLGFQPADSQEVIYVSVPGYEPEPPLDLSSRETETADPILLPEYTQSLFDWFIETLAKNAPTAGAVQP